MNGSVERDGVFLCRGTLTNLSTRKLLSRGICLSPPSFSSTIVILSVVKPTKAFHINLYLKSCTERKTKENQREISFLSNLRQLTHSRKIYDNSRLVLSEARGTQKSHHQTISTNFTMPEGLGTRESRTGKTVSRAALNRLSSTGLLKSSPNSKAGSRVASRQVSDAEDDDLASEGGWSTTDSIDIALSSGEPLASSLEEELENRIESILDRKGSSVQAREEDYAVYIHILRTQFSDAEVSDRVPDLLEAFLRSVRNEMSQKEAINALKAIQITIITDASSAPYDLCIQPLKSAVASSLSRLVKEESLYTLGIAAFFGGTTPDDLLDLLTTYLLEAITSDGASLSAPDDEDVVSAAIDVFALLCTRVPDISSYSHDFVTALAEQLESSSTRVQIAAGEAIATLYSFSYSPRQEGEEPDVESLTLDEDAHLDASKSSSKFKHRYTAYRSTPALLETLHAIARTSTKSMSKLERKSLHTSFNDIAQSVENPTLGPRYSTAIDVGTGRHYGSRLFVKFGSVGGKNAGKGVAVDSWWKMSRLKAVRRAVQGGLGEHALNNMLVKDALNQQDWDDEDGSEEDDNDESRA
jgi:hypothetical protein